TGRPRQSTGHDGSRHGALPQRHLSRARPEAETATTRARLLVHVGDELPRPEPLRLLGAPGLVTPPPRLRVQAGAPPVRACRAALRGLLQDGDRALPSAPALAPQQQSDE